MKYWLAVPLGILRPYSGGQRVEHFALKQRDLRLEIRHSRMFLRGAFDLDANDPRSNSTADVVRILTIFHVVARIANPRRAATMRMGDVFTRESLISGQALCPPSGTAWAGRVA